MAEYLEAYYRATHPNLVHPHPQHHLHLGHGPHHPHHPHHPNHSANNLSQTVNHSNTPYGQITNGLTQNSISGREGGQLHTQYGTTSPAPAVLRMNHTVTNNTAPYQQAHTLNSTVKHQEPPAMVHGAHPHSRVSSNTQDIQREGYHDIRTTPFTLATHHDISHDPQHHPHHQRSTDMNAFGQHHRYSDYELDHPEVAVHDRLTHIRAGHQSTAADQQHVSDHRGRYDEYDHSPRYGDSEDRPREYIDELEIDQHRCAGEDDRHRQARHYDDYDDRHAAPYHSHQTNEHFEEYFDENEPRHHSIDRRNDDHAVNDYYEDDATYLHRRGGAYSPDHSTIHHSQMRANVDI